MNDMVAHSSACVKADKSVIDSRWAHLRHRPNVAPFTLDLSKRTFVDSDKFYKELNRDHNYSMRVNYSYM